MVVAIVGVILFEPPTQIPICQYVQCTREEMPSYAHLDYEFDKLSILWGHLNCILTSMISAFYYHNIAHPYLAEGLFDGYVENRRS